MKAIRITESWFETSPWGVSEPKFTAGQVLPADDAAARRQLDLCNAEEIDVPDDAEKAAAEAAKAAEAAEKAAVKADTLAAAAEAAAAVAK